MKTDKQRKKKRAADFSVISNTSLTLLKFIVGFFTGSISIISEALHSMNDLVASTITMFAVRKSAKPPDKEHHYGHGKIENISALLEAALIIFVAVFIIYEAINRLHSNSKVEYIEVGIAIMFIATITNSLVSMYLYHVSRITDSSALEADAAHLSTDVITTFGVFAGLIVIRLTGHTILDPIIAIFVAILIIITGVKLILKYSKDLMDIKISSDEEQKIRDIINSHKKDFVEFHKLRTRKAGVQRYIDVHLVMAKDKNIEEGHAVADHIEKEIAQKMTGTNVLIHIEPCDGLCEKCNLNKTCKNLSS